MTADERKQARERLRAELRRGIEGVDGVTAAEKYDGKVPPGLRRRGNRRRMEAQSMSLVQNPEGVLIWEPGPIAAQGPAARKRGFRGAVFQGDVVDHLVVEPLEPSMVNQTLQNADDKLTPRQGMLEWKKNQLVTIATGTRPLLGKGKDILLIVHGTFSEAQPIFDQMPPAFWADAAKKYDQILAFNHPTLAVSPMLNALDLGRHLNGEAANIDVVCHSRGGLVTQWWLEEFDRPPLASARRRAIYAGAPMEGTSLASPPHLRHLLSWFSNLADKASELTGALTPMVPWMKVVSLLSRFTAVVTNVVASTPVIDAAVALVPGVEAMSRIANNFELDRLRGGTARPGVERMVITAHYQPPAIGWKFWEYFGNIRERTLYNLFDGLPNDTVVDLKSMDVLRPGSRVKRFDFPTGSAVHHTNYFAQADTEREIRKFLKV